MNKKWIIISAIALFVLANGATFLFAKGKIKIIETVMHKKVKENIENQVKATVSNKESGRSAANTAKTAAADNQYRGFDDSDHFIASEEVQPLNTEEIQLRGGSASNENVARKNLDNSSVNVIGGLSVPYSNTDDISNTNSAQDQSRVANVPQLQINPVSSTPEESPVTPSEDIPMPQLPGGDYETAGDEGGLDNMALPELPDKV